MHRTGKRSLVWAAAGVVLLAFLASACGGGEPEEERAPAEEPAGEGAIRIVMGEMFFRPDRVSVAEGQQVTIELVNEGVVEHEFMVGREVREEEGRPEGYVQDFFEGVDTEFSGEAAELERGEHGTEVYAEAGGSGVLTFTVPNGSAGEWEIGCFVPGHYEAGMRGTFVVEEG